MTSRPSAKRTTVIRRGKSPVGIGRSPTTVSRPSSTCVSLPCGSTVHCSKGFMPRSNASRVRGEALLHAALLPLRGDEVFVAPVELGLLFVRAREADHRNLGFDRRGAFGNGLL